MSARKEKRRPVKQVRLRMDVWQEAKPIVDKKAGGDLTAWVNDLIQMTLEKDKLMSRLSPGLSYVGKSPTSIFIQDAELNRSAEIVLEDGQFQCHICEKNDCLHIEFAKTLPELGYLNRKK